MAGSILSPKALARRRRWTGSTILEIQTEFGISKSTAQQWCQGIAAQPGWQKKGAEAAAAPRRAKKDALAPTAMKMRREGKPHWQIAAALGVSTNTVAVWTLGVRPDLGRVRIPVEFRVLNNKLARQGVPARDRHALIASEVRKMRGAA